MNVVCFTREYKFTMHNQQNSKMATKNDNIAEKNQWWRPPKCIHWHICSHSHTSKLFFHVWIWFLGWRISLIIKWNIFKKLIGVKIQKSITACINGNMLFYLDDHLGFLSHYGLKHDIIIIIIIIIIIMSVDNNHVSNIGQLLVILILLNLSPCIYLD